MRKIFISVFVILFSVLLCVSASATNTDNEVDFDYTGVVGSQYDIDSDASQESSTRIGITSDISYDTKNRLYYIYAADIAKPFTSSVMDGVITTQAVSLTVPDGVAYELYCDGELYSGDISELTELGDYVMRIQSNSGISVQVIAFRIVGHSTGIVSGYTMPEGFVINSVTLDDSPFNCSNSYVSFEQEGDYSVNYSCTATGVAYSLALHIDYTAPVLKLEAVNEGKAWGPVDISDVEEGGSVSVYRNGTKEAYTSVLTKSGQYELVVADSAGNTTDYSFVIMVYFNSGSLVFLAVIVLLIAGLIAYIFVSRKKLRVR